MDSGHSCEIEYISTDNSVWRARLSEVRMGLFRGSASDPDFCHLQAGCSAIHHRDAWIKYKHLDGTFWISRCYSVADPLDRFIKFQFEHHRLDSLHNTAPHFSRELCFLDGCGIPWLATVVPVHLCGIPEFVIRPAL